MRPSHFQPNRKLFMPSRNPIVPDAVIAHRGAPLLAPENTLPSFYEAVRRGAKWLELDVKLTADQRAVIFHDKTLERTSNGTGMVAAASFDYVRSLDAGSYLHPRFAGTQIPTLEEVIEAVLELDVGLQLELKPTPGDDVETAEVALAILRDMWPANRGRLFLSSFSIRSILAARRLMPDVPRAFAVTVPPRDPLALLAETGCQILHVKAVMANAEVLARLSESGIEFALATVNDPAEARRLLDAGAQSLLSDIPNLLEAPVHITPIHEVRS